MSLDTTPSEGAISIEQATSLLSAPVDDAPVVAAPAEAADEPDDASTTPEADTGSEAEEPGDDGEAEESEPEAEQVPEVEAPAWWTAEQKAAFATASPEHKAIMAEVEKGRESYYGKQKEELAVERKKAETEGQTYKSVLNALADVLPQWQQTFQSRWKDVNWAELQQQYTAEEVNQWRFQYEQEQTQLQQAEQQTQAAKAADYQRFLAVEGEKLAQIRPELADPKQGPAKKAELMQYVIDQGVPPEHVKDLMASVVNIAWKAQQYDKAQASLAAKPRPAPVPQRGNTQPTAAAETRTSQQRSIEQISARLSKSGSIDDAVALLQAQRK